jgi:hypothetical protein
MASSYSLSDIETSNLINYLRSQQSQTSGLPSQIATILESLEHSQRLSNVLPLLPSTTHGELLLFTETPNSFPQHDCEMNTVSGCN